jgi:hypothetical protein
VDTEVGVDFAEVEFSSQQVDDGLDVIESFIPSGLGFRGLEYRVVAL